MAGLYKDGNEPAGFLKAISQFADDIAVLIKGDTGARVTTNLQNFLQEIEIWNKKWRTTMNTNTSSTVTFTYLKKEKALPLYFNCSPVPQHEEVRYLGLIPDQVEKVGGIKEGRKAVALKSYRSAGLS
ncbi:hypothetical protein ANN_13850 [Periplaneta americana]|uniref:Reverse transcriptase domain-containing protein n=1 Tax=Periplaneta americana TaxID=6978 RepID=A0ABQ8SW13_PERAM|nr:hypothetical protein ANN_13850 [Periplaneta americana]